MTISKPLPAEHPAYYANYIKFVPEGNLIAELEKQKQNTKVFFESISEEKGNNSYAPGKWSIKEVLCHIIDTERIFAYRALRFARKDSQILPGYDQDEYIKNANANNRSIEQLLNEYIAVRNASIELIKSISKEDLINLGNANNNPVSVRAILYLIAGHELHHLEVIKNKYFV